MPIYEYHCEDCQAESSIYFGSFASAAATSAACPGCGGVRLTRLISRCAVGRAGAAGGVAEAPPLGTRGDDPRSLARGMREAARGRDMGDDFREVAARLERGEQPTSIESSLRRRVGQTMSGH